MDLNVGPFAKSNAPNPKDIRIPRIKETEINPSKRMRKPMP
jgi:hypothetical protein